MRYALFSLSSTSTVHDTVILLSRKTPQKAFEVHTQLTKTLPVPGITD